MCVHVVTSSTKLIMADSSSSLTVDSVIHGHHVYKAVWTPFVGEELSLEQEHGNRHDFFCNYS